MGRRFNSLEEAMRALSMGTQETAAMAEPVPASAPATWAMPEKHRRKPDPSKRTVTKVSVTLDEWYLGLMAQGMSHDDVILLKQCELELQGAGCNTPEKVSAYVAKVCGAAHRGRQAGKDYSHYTNPRAKEVAKRRTK